MSDQANPGTVHVRLIEDEILALLEQRGRGALGADAKIILATLLFSDSEGVAEIGAPRLRSWLADENHERASGRFVQRRIEALIRAGVLAPRSTTSVLGSMFGRRAEVGAG